MLLVSSLLLLLSNSLTVRRDVSLLFSRIAIFTLIYCIISTYESFYITYIEGRVSEVSNHSNHTAGYIKLCTSQLPWSSAVFQNWVHLCLYLIYDLLT